MGARVAINGFGRIGRLVARAIIESGRSDIDIVLINDLGPSRPMPTSCGSTAFMDVFLTTSASRATRSSSAGTR